MKKIIQFNWHLLLGLIFVMFSVANKGKAADANNGTGTMTVVSNYACASSTGNSFVFTYTLTGGTAKAGAQVTLEIPSGWTAPQIGNSLNSGYVSYTSATSKTLAVSGTGPWTISITYAANAAANEIVTLNYAGGGTKITTPATTGTFAFTSKFKKNGGTLTNLATQPIIGVYGSPTISGSLVVCVGSTTQLTGSGPTTGATWSSGTPGVAMISNVGLVTGISTGTSLITYTTSCGTITATVTVIGSCIPLRNTDLPNPESHFIKAPAGTLVIPMDNTLQVTSGHFNLKAYGLVVSLLNNKVPVRWIIKAGKLHDGIDFTANASQLYPTSGTAASTNFSGGPMLIFMGDVPSGVNVATIINNFNSGLATEEKVNVYQLIAATSVDQRYILSQKPKAAILDDGGNASIHLGYMDDAGILEANDNFHIVASAVNLPDQCYTFASEAHSDAITANLNAIHTYVENGGNFLAECLAVDTYENNTAGHFYTSNGITIVNTETTTYSYPNSDLSFGQYVGQFDPINIGGAERNWVLNGGAFINNGYIVQSGTGANSGIMGQTAAKIGTGLGHMVFFTGGHDFGKNTSIDFINGVRSYLNAYLTPSGMTSCNFLSFEEDISVSKSVNYSNVCSRGNVIFTISARHNGPSLNNITGLTLHDVLPSGLTYVSSTVTQGSYVSGTGIWSIGTLTPYQTAILTITATAGSAGSYTNEAYVDRWKGDYVPENDTSRVVLTVNALPTITGSLSVCPGSTTQLTGSGTPASPIAWVSESIGVATVDNTGLVSGISAGTSVITYTNSNGCSNSVTVAVNSLPMADAGPATDPFCQGGASAPLGGSVGGTATGGAWSTTAGGVFSPNATDLNAIWTPPSSFTGTATLTLTTSGGQCGIVAASKTQLVNANPDSPTAGNNGPVCLGGTLSLTASIISGATYSWTGPLDYHLTSQNPTVSTNASTAMSGDYFVTATVNNCPSSPATTTVTVIADPSVTTHPASFTECIGGTAQLSVTATGGTPSLNYQWYSGATNSNTGGTLIAGATSDTYTPPSTPAGTLYYYVIVSATGNGCGSATSNVAVVNVIADPSVTTHPASFTECIGGTAQLSVTATGGTPSLNYQWYSGATNSNTGGTLIAGATSDAYTPPSTSAGTLYYYVIVSATGNGCGSATSDVAVVNVIADPSVTTHPPSFTECIGGTAQLSVTATGGTPSLNYQWYSGATNSNTTGTLIEGATSDTYTPPSTSAGTLYYYVIVSATGNGCGSATSNVAVVNVIADPSVTTHPASFTECIGGTAQLSVTATGGTPSLNYQWYSGATNSNTGGMLIAGATSDTYTPPSTSAGTLYYYVIVSATGNGCGSATSNVAVVNVIADPSVTTHPASFTECIGGTAQLSVTATGGTPSLNYQWYSGATNSNTGGTLIAGATSDAYTPPSTSAGTLYYYVIVSATGNGCGSATSDVAVVNVIADPSVTTHPASFTECIGGTAQLSVTATGGTPSLNYQWYSGATNSNTGGTLIEGATSDTYTPPSTLAGTLYYYVIVSATGNGCGSATSNVAVVNVIADPSVTTHPASFTECIGGTAQLSVTATGGTPSLNYQWYSGATNSNTTGTLIAGATSDTYTPPSTSAGTLYYYVIVSATGNGCGSATSDVAVVNVIADPSVTIHPASFTECIGGTAQLSVTATGGTPSLNYQWYSGATNSNTTGTLIEGATSDTYTPPSTSAGTLYYYVIVSATGNGCGSATSDVAVVNVIADPSVTIHPASFTECIGGTAQLSVTATGGTPSLNYQWYSGATNSNTGGTLIEGATSDTYTPPSTSAGTLYYYVIVSATGNGCGSATSDVAVVNVIGYPETPTQSIDCSLGFNNARITVTSPTGSGIEYSLDSGPFQTALIFANVVNGSHSITVRNTAGCSTTGSTFQVSCGCVNGPALLLSSNGGSTSGITPVTINGNTFGGSATEVTITENGAGSVIPSSTSTSPFSFTYTPTTGDAENIVRITVTTNNPLGSPCAAAVATYVLTVNQFNTNPDINATFVNVPVSGDVHTNDQVPSGTTYGTPVLVSSPSGSAPTIPMNPDGTYIFTGNLPGVYVYNVPVCVVGTTVPSCPTELLTITVEDLINPNPPIANTDIATTQQGSPVTLNTLANDAAGNPGGALVPSSVTVMTPPSSGEGTASVDPSTGNITFTPAAGFTGIVIYTYRVCDNTLPTALCGTAIQQVTVLPPTVSNSTEAADDYKETAQGATLTVAAASGVLANDTDPQGNSQTVITTTAMTVAGKGTVTISTDGNYVFVPLSGFTGPVEFVYTIHDNGTPVASASATLHILVTNCIPPIVTNTPLTQTICSGGSTTLVTLTSNVASTTFAWIASATTGITGFAASGTGTIPVQTISTTGTTQGTVTYAITPTASGCAGSVTNYTVLVNPNPAVTNTPLTQTVCSGGSTSLVTLTSDIAGTTFAWTATATTGVIGFAASGTGAIPVQTISTTGTTQGTVTYAITPNAVGCPGSVTNYTVLVNPNPAVTNTPLTQTVCSGGSTTLVTLTSNVAGTTFAWTASATTGVIGFVASGTGAIPVQTISTTGTTQGTVTYAITPNAVGCPGSVTNYTVLVNPNPAVTNTPLTQTVCSGGSTTLVTLTSNVAGTTFAWTASATTGVIGFAANGTGTIPVQTISTTVTTQGTVTYAITPTAAGCTGSVTNYTVLVNPNPAVTNTPLTQTVCSGGSTSLVTLTSDIAGTTFAWTATATTGVTGFAASGTGAIPVQTISTTGTTQGTVTYAITPNAAGCPGSVTNYTVLVNPVPLISTYSMDCSLGFGNAVISVTNPVTGYEYSLDGGPYQLGYTFSGVSNGSHRISVRNASGCITTGSSFQVSCGCVDGPTLVLSSNSGTTCGTTPVTVSGNTFGGNATAITITENGAGSVNPSSTITSPFAFTYTPAAGDAGNTVTITVTTNNPLGSPCVAAVAIYTLTVNSDPSAPIIGSITQPTCALATGSVVLSGLPAGAWTINPGAVSGTGASTTISGLVSDTYNYTVTNSAGCVSAATANAVINAKPNCVPVAVNDTTISPQDTQLTITVITNDFDPDGTIDVTTVDLDPSTPGIQKEFTVPGQATYSVDINGVVTVTLVSEYCGTVTPVGYTVNDNLGATSNVATINIFVTCVNHPPVIDLPDVRTSGNTPVTICSPINDPDVGDTFTSSICGAPKHGSVTTAITTDGKNVCAVYTPETGFTGKDSICVTVCDQKGLCGSSTSVITVTLIKLELTTKAVTCTGSKDGLIDLTVNGGTAPYTFIWTGPSNFIASTEDISGLSGGSYNVKVTDAIGEIKTASATVSESGVLLNLNATPKAVTQKESVDGSVTLEVIGGSIELVVTGATTPFIYDWAGPANFAATTKDLANLSQGTYNVTVTDANNCIKTTSAIVDIQVVLAEDDNCELFIPNVFTPNGDGVHDYFEIRCLYNFENSEVQIFNRNGNLVFKKDHYGNIDYWGSKDKAYWNGHSENNLNFMGSELPVGTYYYILKLGNGRVYTGFVFLGR